MNYQNGQKMAEQCAWAIYLRFPWEGFVSSKNFWHSFIWKQLNTNIYFRQNIAIVLFNSLSCMNSYWLHFLLYLDFLSPEIHESQNSSRKGRQILIRLYHFHPFHEHLDISRVITVKSSALHIANHDRWPDSWWSISMFWWQFGYRILIFSPLLASNSYILASIYLIKLNKAVSRNMFKGSNKETPKQRQRK